MKRPNHFCLLVVKKSSDPTTDMSLQYVLDGVNQYLSSSSVDLLLFCW